MSGFVNPFVSGRHLRLVEFAIWLAVTLALLAVGAGLLHLQMHDALRSEAKARLARFDTLHRNVTTAFADLRGSVKAEPCSEQFIREIRRVAFKPDGLNEFIYAPNGVVTCSTSLSKVEGRASLGAPDIAARDDGIAFWIDRSLGSVGLPDVRGSVAYQAPFAIVIPVQGSWQDGSSWVSQEFVHSGQDGRAWHIGGSKGIFAAASNADQNDHPLSTMHAVTCGKDHPYCAAVKADAMEIARMWRTELAFAVGLIAFYAAWPASVINRALARYWSFEQRFRRTLNSNSVLCAYQPILDLATGEISGCEVLVRWRDVDGSIVAPDKFVDIVESSHDTLAFTTMVAERAFLELAENLPPGTKRLQINFNIFPRDLDCTKLREAFRSFESERDRFQLAFEIVESDALAIDAAQREIEALAEAGIRTYIDDFGSGYSSIHRVASLAIHGVKLDRSFAMAPKESLMARMLVHALDMIGSSGREIVVEGVETQERLALLVETRRVAYAQGYLISRPLTIERLVAFLAQHDASMALNRRVAA